MNHDSIMEIFVKSLTLKYQFLMFQAMILIQAPSLRSQQDNGIVILAWIALEPSFQFWNFLAKTQAWLCMSGAAGRFFALGLASCLCMEWLGLVFLSKESKHWWNGYWFSWQIFSNLFHANLLQIMSNHHNSFQIWSYTKS